MTAATKPGPAVYPAIAAVMAALAKEGIAKDRRNTQGSGYNFRGIDDIYNVLSSILAEHQLVIIPRVIAREQVERVSKQGGALFYTTVEVEFDLISAADGSSHTARTVGEAMDSGDKSSNKAMSAAYKYMAFQTFCIPVVGENDADAETHDVTPRRPSGPSAAAQYAADQLKSAKSKAEFTHFWEGQKAGLRESLSEPDFAHVIGVMREEAKRFAEPTTEAGPTPFDQQEAA